MTQQQADFEIQNLRQALTGWRVCHRAPVPIPAEIWSGAVRVAAALGVAPVARELKIDYAKLKRLVVGDVPARVPRGTKITTTTTFLEVSARGLQPLSCRLEVTSREGAWLQGYLDGAAPADVAAIFREFIR